MTDSTALIPADQKTALENVEKVATEYGLAALENTSPLERTLMIATGTRKLRELLTPKLMEPIMALQGSTLGFKTDKDTGGGYPVEVVRDVTIEAMLRGFRVVDNETNIIAGRFYAAKNGCRRRVLEWPGLTKFSLELSIPTDRSGTAYVDAIASWELNGRPDEIVRRDKTAIPIRRNTGMIDDAILGKAERKMYAAVLNRLSTFVIPDGEVEGEIIDVESHAAPRRSSLNDYATAKPEQQTPAFDPALESEALDGFRSNMESARDPKEIAAVQKQAAEWVKAGKLSPDSLAAVNDLATKQRGRLRGELPLGGDAKR